MNQNSRANCQRSLVGNQSGVTLIALVITTIILIILSGITVRTLMRR